MKAGPTSAATSARMTAMPMLRSVVCTNLLQTVSLQSPERYPSAFLPPHMRGGAREGRKGQGDPALIQLIVVFAFARLRTLLRKCDAVPIKFRLKLRSAPRKDASEAKHAPMTIIGRAPRLAKAGFRPV